MSRPLPLAPDVEQLEREAELLLRRLRDRAGEALPLLRALPRFADASDADIEAAAALADAQLALALTHGFTDWNALKAHVEVATPRLRVVRPVLRIGSFEQAVEHYVDWLGFALDWDWREAPGQPVVAAMSRDECAFMLNEHPDTPGPTVLHLDVANLDALVAEWNGRRAGSAKASVSPPYEFMDVRIVDPWRNTLVFEGKDEADETRRRDAVRPKMRRFVEARLEAGEGLPTPEEIRAAIGPPLGTAIEVLNEYPDYGEVFNARRPNG